ncbi:MAG: ATP-binding protein, partial [Planctomycetes bacterium]|nr:ATP-binding protein [Planctomycetota bacterium]
ADIEVQEAGEVHITADGEQLRQVFLNLGLNALDATDGRGPVVFRLKETAGGALVRTLDAGRGVETAIREQIFEPFFTTKTTGTGLGLSIARRIIEDHGGTLELEEGPEGWTCVKVFLPFAEGKAKPPELSEPAAAVETG